MIEERGGPLRRRLRNVKVGLLLQIAVAVTFVVGGVVLVVLVRHHMRQQALAEAESKARIILDRNLATHTYFSHQLKPHLFEWSEPFREEEYFNPVWMSSTYAVREIDEYFQSLTPADYYYKECAINARSPENEADAYERRFIEELNQDPSLTERSLLRRLDGEPTFVTLRRGETMEASCLRCHSSPEVAPEELVDVYGPERSFGREVGEVISAISIRVPLMEAYGKADQFAARLSLLLVALLVGLFAAQSWLSQSFLLAPVDRLREKALQIAHGGEHLGEQISLPAGQELKDLTLAFNKMSRALQRSYDHLEEQVEERTAQLTRAKERLERSERKFREVFEASPIAIELYDADAQLIEANQACLEMFGASSLQAVRGFQLFEDPNLPEEARKKLRAGQTARYETIFDFARVEEQHLYETSKSGTLHLDVRITPLRTDRAPAPHGYLVQAQDVSRRKQAEEKLEAYTERLEEMVEKRTEQLRQAQEKLLRQEKLALLGQLAGSINHELRDPLGNIKNSAYFLDMALEEPDEDVEETLEIIDQNVDRANSIVSSLLNFARTEEPQRESLDVSALLDDVLLDTDLPDGIEINREMDEDLPTIPADPEQLRRVFRNIIDNAIEAMPEGGQLTVRASVASPGPSTPEREVVVSVSDTGEGISERARERVFEPLFTTKEEGVGLGLALVETLVEAHGGTIEVESEVGQGSTFTVRLPGGAGEQR